ncbi:hypothetical protein DL771_010564 [Monosporascus sp. 5C6A]|nr:hypothetical protein DL771_010564 [Monosporascus sp. 5C6A]
MARERTKVCQSNCNKRLWADSPSTRSPFRSYSGTLLSGTLPQLNIPNTVWSESESSTPTRKRLSNPAALAIAAEHDLERRCGQVRGPLHGVPVLVKESIATIDAMQTTAGSWALLGSVVPQDSDVVSSLRVAGAVVLGKANMSEWASVRSRAESAGYSPRGGQVRNPYDLRKTPHGSSSGSAVAVSANLAPLAIGTETDTSIIGPASTNGIVGIKPTVGLTPRSGAIPVSESMDIVSQRRQPDSYLDCLSTAEALRGARFGLPMKRVWEEVPHGCKEVASRVLDAVKAADAEILDVDFPSVEERVNEEGTWDWEHGGSERSEWTVAKVEAYDGINAYLAKLKESPVRSLEDVIRYNRENAGTEDGEPRVHPAFPDGQQTLLEIAESSGVRDDTYHAALRHIRRQTRENGIDAALRGCRGGRGDGDGEPVVTTALGALLFCDRRDVGQQYAAQAGYHIICIPVGVDENGLPVSLWVPHTVWKEAELVKWASAIEDLRNRENGWRATPAYGNLYAEIIPLEGLD